MLDFVLIDFGAAVSSFNMYEDILDNMGYDAPDEFEGRSELCRWGIF